MPRQYLGDVFMVAVDVLYRVSVRHRFCFGRQGADWIELVSGAIDVNSRTEDNQ